MPGRGQTGSEARLTPGHVEMPMQMLEIAQIKFIGKFDAEIAQI